MKKLLSVLLAIAMLTMMFVGCQPANNNEGEGEIKDNIIKIGVFEPATGENAAGGQQEVIGIRYARTVRPTVTVGGVEYTIELVEVDNQSDKAAAVTAAQNLVNADVLTVLGSYGSGVSIAAGETFSAAQIPAIGCSCTNPQVTLGNDYYYRVCFLDPFQGTVMANYAISQGYKKAAVIYQNGDDYSTGLANYFMKAYKETEGELVYEGIFNTNETDFNAILTSAKAAGADFYYIPSSIQTAGLIIKQARQLGIDAVLSAGDTWENASIIANAGAENCEGVLLSTFFDENDKGAADFVNGFKAYLAENEEAFKLNGSNDTVAAVTALGYDAYMTAITAIESIEGEITGAAIKDALKTVDYDGVTGKITFDENGDANKDMAYIKTISDGAFKFIGTQNTAGVFTPAQAEADELVDNEVVIDTTTTEEA